MEYESWRESKSGSEPVLSQLDCGYIDLFLMHVPDIAAAAANPGGQVAALEETWAEMEKLVDNGKCRAIGVSNFSAKNLERVLACARIKPVVNEVEMHPYLPQQRLVDYCRAHDIVVTAYMSLGSADSADSMSHGGKKLLEDRTVRRVASKVGKTPAQVLLRWALHRGTAVIPKSATKEHLVENFALFEWELPDEEFGALNGITRRDRLLKMNDCCGEHLPAKSPIDIWDDPEGLTDE